jgi:ribA/ribD-fused uncharacterized protein
MDYQLVINNIIVGSIEITEAEFPALGGKFTPNDEFRHFKPIYDKYFSDIPELEREAEEELDQLVFSLIDENYLREDIFYMFIHVDKDYSCTWRPSKEKKYVKFYRTDEIPYGCFSNFSKHPIQLEGKTWPTSEHYFQAKKFEGLHYEDEIRLAKTPAIAARMGNTREYVLREDWEIVKEDIMRTALKAKFTQHEDCRQLLLQTQDALLIEHTKNDNYWADGGDGKGKNRLGVLLMELRDELSEL